MKIKSLCVVVLVTLAAATRPASADLIVNGGFELGSFFGWTVDATPSYNQYITTSPVNSGTYAAQIAGYSLGNQYDIFGYGPNELSQAVSTAFGQTYTLSFAFYQVGSSGIDNGLIVLWNNLPVFSETDTAHAYVVYSVNVVGTGGSDILTFNSYNNPAFTYLAGC